MKDLESSATGHPARVGESAAGVTWLNELHIEIIEHTLLKAIGVSDDMSGNRIACLSANQILMDFNRENPQAPAAP